MRQVVVGRVCKIYTCLFFLQLHQYRSEYSSMLSSLALASELDPGWPEPKEKLKETRQFLRSMTDMVVHKVCQWEMLGCPPAQQLVM